VVGNVFAADFKPVENLPLEHFGIDLKALQGELRAVEKKEEARL
jgi:hypothetical protein